MLRYVPCCDGAFKALGVTTLNAMKTKIYDMERDVRHHYHKLPTA